MYFDNFQINCNNDYCFNGNLYVSGILLSILRLGLAWLERHPYTKRVEGSVRVRSHAQTGGLFPGEGAFRREGPVFLNKYIAFSPSFKHRRCLSQGSGWEQPLA